MRGRSSCVWPSEAARFRVHSGATATSKSALSLARTRSALEPGTSRVTAGGSKEGVGIGETDDPIIRHPITHVPYVPGSCVKGKIRCLLELQHGHEPERPGMPCACGKCLVCQLFGCHNARKLKSPSRLVFRDSQPAKATLAAW